MSGAFRSASVNSCSFRAMGDRRTVPNNPSFRCALASSVAHARCTSSTADTCALNRRDPTMLPSSKSHSTFRRALSLKGRRPTSGGRTLFDWLYVSGFARLRTGQTFRVLWPRGNADRMADALTAFAAHADPDGAKERLVPVDNAGGHVAKRLVVPPNGILNVLPPCTPELQPVEAFWPPVREAVAKRSIGRIDRLRAILRTRLSYLARNPVTVRPFIRFHWTRCLERSRIDEIR